MEKINVLLIDDSAADRYIVRRYLKDICTFIEEESYYDGLFTLNTQFNKIDFIILDYTLNDIIPLGGAELKKTAEKFQIPFVFFSGHRCQDVGQNPETWVRKEDLVTLKQKMLHILGECK